MLAHAFPWVGGGDRKMLTDLGPSFVKAGQVLASRPDIIREDYMNELCTLQDDVPPFPDEQVQQACVPALYCRGLLWGEKDAVMFYIP